MKLTRIGVRKKLLLFWLVWLGIGGLMAYAKSPEEEFPKVGPVKINPRPSGLEGKTVLLRWNGKYNGDKFLNRVAELFTQRVKGVKIVKMWEVDSSTGVISKSLEVSEQVATKILKQKPDLVIASQAD